MITDVRAPYNFGLSTDCGVAWLTVEGNVVARADSTAVLTVTPPLEYVDYRDNVLTSIRWAATRCRTAWRIGTVEPGGAPIRAAGPAGRFAR